MLQRAKKSVPRSSAFACFSGRGGKKAIDEKPLCFSQHAAADELLPILNEGIATAVVEKPTGTVGAIWGEYGLGELGFGFFSSG